MTSIMFINKEEEKNVGTTYFSISTNIYAGFNDQLSQFSIFYKLGISLKFQYFHIPFFTTRSKSRFSRFIHVVFAKLSSKSLVKIYRILSKFDNESWYDIYSSPRDGV